MQDPEDDEVESEYPLYMFTADQVFKDKQTKLLLLEFPLRPTWRPYDTVNATHVRYKPKHRVMEMRVKEPEAEGGYVALSGKGAPHDCTLCALVKVDDAFTLLAVDDIIQMRPDMSKSAAASSAAAEEEDPDYKPPVAELKKAADKKPAGKAVMRTLQVEVQKRETERQMETRMRSHAHLREQQDAEPWIDLRIHDRSQDSFLTETCRKANADSANATVDMSMSPEDYLTLISPSTWIAHDTPENCWLAAIEEVIVFSWAQLVEVPSQREEVCRQTAPRNTGASTSKTAGPTLDRASLAAVTEALEALFGAHSVVTLPDARSWLGSYQPKPEARAAATLPDKQLHELMVGGGSITYVQNRYVLTSVHASSDSFRALVLDLLQHSAGLKKADVMSAAKQQGLEVSEHLYNKVLKDLCVAQGAVWSLRPGGVV